ncbi:hypothetical protein CHS0354_018349 [Potamilus streckersoni]|uniref:4-hydroxy-tetrahydrodipicolinate synthase n=1 Tax=Potamilus streckersoni TaxID=2493646 RepID=A0AAE0TAE2_9BIVA|nr:hypothetical protein CHS0354_018349 [Potamilus streckersoni]
MSKKWQGVFPAITTQISKNGTVNTEATCRHIECLIKSGISGLIVLGSLGENQTLTPEEKRAVISAAKETVNGRIPLLSGVAETSTAESCRFVADGEKAGLDGYMLMPPMIYCSHDPEETLVYYESVARATGLPIMIYNNPISYGHDVSSEMMKRLADRPNFTAVKESSGDTRRITELRRELGDRFQIFTGVDNLILESAVLGLDGWVAGAGIAFPEENQKLWDLTREGKWDKARELYAWFTPLLNLDVTPKLVQYIKLTVQEVGLGEEWVKPPRLPLAGEERKYVLNVIRKGYLGMCGHGTIGLVVTLQHCGLLSAGECRIETPVGIVSAVLNKDGSVSVDNVPAYRRTANMAVYLPEAGKTVHGDLAWGGNWFFICADHGQKLTLDNIPALTRLSRDIRHALNAMGCPEVDHIELTGPAHDKTAHGRNFVLCPGGAYDRSPCGTGTSAKVACLAAEGKLKPEEIWIQESITGSLFQASYRPHPQNKGHILPRIRGTAFVTAECEFILNEADPLCWGMPPTNLNLSPV